MKTKNNYNFQKNSGKFVNLQKKADFQSAEVYKKVASYEAEVGEVKKVLLLYSGGLDTSVMLKWIQDNYKCQVVTLTADLGQQHDDLEAIKQKALKFGA